MSEVVSLASYREAQEPHWSGTCVCLGCRHEWVGVGPIGVATGLTCPACDLPKGVTKHLFGADEGDLAFVCNCGSEALTVYRRKGKFYQRCMGCGVDHTEAIYG